MEKKYQIFISSTYTDLIEERKVVQETILSMYHIPIGMEMFSADDIEQWEIIKDTIDTSDYYILLLSHRYGSITKEGISYTQKEYEYALEKKIPILGFIIDPSIPILPSNMETDQTKIIKLNKFKELVKQKPIEWWKDKNDLSTKVAIALTKQFGRNNRPGWIRADKFNLEETQNEIIQLVRRNRELEKENKTLKEQIIDRYPVIEVKIQYNEDGNLKYLPEDEIINIKRNIEGEYYKIEDDFLSENQKNNQKLLKKVKEYNESLPSQKELDSYEEKLKRYKAIKEYNNQIEIEISNIGTCKANNLSVILEFPDDLIIKSKNEIDNLEPPEAPLKKENPLYSFDSINNLTTIPEFDFSINKLKPLKIGNLLMRRDELNGNILEINEETLMHTYYMTFDDYVIAAIKEGTYIIKCEIMCEEFIETKTTEIILEFK